MNVEDNTPGTPAATLGNPGTPAMPCMPDLPDLTGFDGAPGIPKIQANPLRDETATDNDKLWATLIHLTVLVPVFSFVPLLCIWLQTRKDSVYIDDHGKEALSFQISMFIWQVVAGIMAIFIIGIPFVIALPILAIVMGIVNAIKANQGYYVRYPITIRFFQ